MQSHCESTPAVLKDRGCFGLINIREKQVEFPAIYSSALDFNEAGFAITLKVHKAGAIDRYNNVRVPFIYNEIEFRYRREEIPEEERPLRTMDDGRTMHVGPTYRNNFLGFACFTNESGAQAYDEHCRPDRFYDWE